MFSFIRVTMVMVSLHSNRTMTKTIYFFNTGFLKGSVNADGKLKICVCRGCCPEGAHLVCSWAFFGMYTGRKLASWVWRTLLTLAIRTYLKPCPADLSHQDIPRTLPW